ncbi:uncharacterized protein [Coffea arabica]|uniref:Uncharacterized protein isoform X2 n=1 Tax=Coffea arabica TaxID=13443 RepID=A0ABM4U3B9_COFAR
MSLNDDEEEESSGSDADDGFDEDMEALRRACLLTGTNVDDLENPCSPSPAVTATTSGAAATTGSDSDADDAEDDLELVRNIQKRFAIVTDSALEPLTLEPLYSIQPSANEDDDFETLRAIQRRFFAYSEGGLGESTEVVSHKPENSNLQEESPSYLDKINNATKDIDACSKVNAGTQPSDFTEAFVDAIKKNRSCQKLIRSKLLHIETRIEELKKLKERVKILKDFQATCRKRVGQALSQKKDARVQLISVPKLSANVQLSQKKSSPMQYGPAENSQVANYREALEKFPVSVIRNKWSKEEREKLSNGVKQQFQKVLLQRSVDLLSDGDGSFDDSDNLDSIVASIRDLDITPDKMRQFLPKVNWDELASMYLPGRSGAECQARWLNCEDPLINQNSWTSTEDKNLLHVVQQKGLSNWIDIAVSMGTNRTPFQCLARYQRSLNASIIKREWTEEEDNQLRAAVEAFGESNWQVVASAMEGRIGTQCSNRWMKSLHPARQRVGKWTPEEDKRLKVAVMLFGPKTWKKIARFVPGRTQVQCRERWVNCVDPSLNRNDWTQEEDSKLKAAIEEHGYCWSKVAACVPPRTDSQCRRRWKVLLPHEVPWLQAAKKMQRAALISNFVDRESERPGLLPSDFVPLPEITCTSESERINLSGHQNWGLSNLGSEEVLASGTEVERFTSDSISRRKRQRRKSRRTNSIASSEEHLSYCPDTMHSSETMHSNDLETLGGFNHCQNRSSQKSKGMASGYKCTSKKRARRTHPKRDGCSDSVDRISSSNNVNSLIMTGGEETRELVRDDGSGTQCKQDFDQHPSYSRCNKSLEENGGCNDTEGHQLLFDNPNLLLIAKGEEVVEVDRSERAATLGQKRDDESASRCKQYFVQHPSHSSRNELREENGGCNDTEGHQLSFDNPNLLLIENGEEAVEVNRSDGVATLGRKASKLHPRRSGHNESPDGIPGISFPNTAEFDVVHDTVVNKQRSETKSTPEKSESTNAVDHHSSSLLNSTVKKDLGTSGVIGSKRGKRSRNRDETSVVEETENDDMTLAEFCNKRLAAENTGDDDMTLAMFCNKIKKRRRG